MTAPLGADLKKDLKEVYRMTWWGLMLRGLLSLAVGVFILVRPLASVAAFALVIALWALFGGLVDIVHAIDVHKVLKHWWVMLLSGLVGVGFGIAALIYYPILALTFAVVLFAWWLMLTGVLGIYAAIQAKGLGTHWVWQVVFGVLSLVVGVFALIWPPVTLVTIMALIAWFGLLGGIVLIVGAFKLQSLPHP
jgi:uncharacterized membrane protein HdeD (DUF308 family)